MITFIQIEVLHIPCPNNTPQIIYPTHVQRQSKPLISTSPKVSQRLSKNTAAHTRYPCTLVPRRRIIPICGPDWRYLDSLSLVQWWLRHAAHRHHCWNDSPPMTSQRSTSFSYLRWTLTPQALNGPLSASVHHVADYPTGGLVSLKHSPKLYCGTQTLSRFRVWMYGPWNLRFLCANHRMGGWGVGR